MTTHRLFVFLQDMINLSADEARRHWALEKQCGRKQREKEFQDRPGWNWDHQEWGGGSGMGGAVAIWAFDWVKRDSHLYTVCVFS